MAATLQAGSRLQETSGLWGSSSPGSSLSLSLREAAAQAGTVSCWRGLGPWSPPQCRCWPHPLCSQPAREVCTGQELCLSSVSPGPWGRLGGPGLLPLAPGPPCSLKPGTRKSLACSPRPVSSRGQSGPQPGPRGRAPEGGPRAGLCADRLAHGWAGPALACVGAPAPGVPSIPRTWGLEPSCSGIFCVLLASAPCSLWPLCL